MANTPTRTSGSDGKTKMPPKPMQGRSNQMTSETSQRSQGPAATPSQTPKPQASKSTATPPNVAGSMVAPVPPQDDGSREARIAREAYYRAEKRGFAPGREMDDWLEAERELDKNKQ